MASAAHETPLSDTENSRLSGAVFARELLAISETGEGCAKRAWFAVIASTSALHFCAHAICST
jgi:hypothetical protein